MTTAEQSFQFATASYLTRVENYVAETIDELNAGLAETWDSAVFYHTFETLGRHHFLTEGFSNDFAQWVLAALNQPVLAERLAGIDIPRQSFYSRNCYERGAANEEAPPDDLHNTQREYSSGKVKTGLGEPSCS